MPGRRRSRCGTGSRDAGVTGFSAYIHPDHRASAGVARALGLSPTGTVVNGEIRWIDG